MDDELDIPIILERNAQKEREIKRDYLFTVRQEFEKEFLELEGLFDLLVLNDKSNKYMTFDIKHLMVLNNMDQLKYQKNRMEVIEKMLEKYGVDNIDDHYCLVNINDLTIANLKSEFGYDIDILKSNSQYTISIDEIISLTNLFSTHSNNIMIKLFIILEHFIFYYNKSIPSLINQKEFTKFLSIICNYEKLSQFLKSNNGYKELEYLVKITFCSVNGQQEEEDFLMNVLSCRPKHDSQFQLTSILKDNLQFGGCNVGSISNKSLFSFYFTEIINLDKLNFKINKSIIRKDNLELQNDNIIPIKRLNDVILLNILKYLILIKDYGDNERKDDGYIYGNQYYNFKNGVDIVNVSMVSSRFHRLMGIAISLIDWSQFDNIELLKSEIDYDCEKCLIKEPPHFTKYHILLKTTSGNLFKKVCQSIETLVIDTIGVYPYDYTLNLIDSCNIVPPFGSFENLKSLVIIGRACVSGDQTFSGLFGLPIQYIILNGNSKLLNFTLIDRVHIKPYYDFLFIKQLLSCHKGTLKTFNLVKTKKSNYHFGDIINLIKDIPSIKLTFYLGNKIVEKFV
ncbi:hypothetical protein ACTA71_007551 [Dictyostelium dimigraforme]